jgi:DnaJ-domain-containing protein 1
MGIPERLARLARMYATSWLEKSGSDFPPSASADGDLSDEEVEALFAEWDRAQGNRPPSRPTHLERYFRRLEISPDADLKTIRAAWKNLMRQYHPDRFGTTPEKIETATKVCQELTEAYLELTHSLRQNSPRTGE